MKIVIDNNGQTCNKFWSYLAPIAYTIRLRKKVYVLFPDASLQDYPNLQSNKYLKVCHIKLISKCVSYKIQEKILRRLFTNKYYNLISSLKRRFKNIIWDSWEDRNILLTENEKYLALKILSPDDNIKLEVNKVFNDIRKYTEIIIGVHIRRGDYAKWLGGEYFYSFVQYKAVCDTLKKDFPNKRIKFFLSSNENIDFSIFTPTDFFSFPASSSSKDLYALSQCDYIVGPPSTFSRWAAFNGDKPIRFILPNNSLTKSFRKLKSLEQYETGEIVSEEKKGKLYLS